MPCTAGCERRTGCGSPTPSVPRSSPPRCWPRCGTWCGGADRTRSSPTCPPAPTSWHRRVAPTPTCSFGSAPSWPSGPCRNGGGPAWTAWVRPRSPAPRCSRRREPSLARRPLPRHGSAAPAAWLGGASGDPHARAYLKHVQARGGGPVPSVTPLSHLEAAWVLNVLAVGGFRPPVPPRLLRRLEEALGPAGAAAAPGLPADCRHTAGVLSALMRHGRLHSPEPLLEFRSAGGFADQPGSDEASVSGNAHALECVALYLTHRPAAASRFAAAAQLAAGWLRDHQHPDGYWRDRHHASPYYAVTLAVRALLLHDAAGHRPAIDRALAWLRGTQRGDGSWGRWEGTVEETAYAVQTLARAARHRDTARAVARGCHF